MITGARPPVCKRRRLLIYKIIAVLFAAFLFLMPDNINAVPDMDMRVLVTALGLDVAAGRIRCVAQMIVPVAAGGSVGSNQVAEGDGNSVADALNNLSLGLGRRVELGQCDMVIVGPELAGGGKLIPALAYLMSAGTISPGANLVYSDSIPVAEFMKSANELGEKSGAGLNNFIMYSKEEMHVSTLTLLDFLSETSDKSAASIIPCVTIRKQQDSGAAGSGQERDAGGGQQGGDSGAQPSSPKATIDSADTVAVFTDGKFVRRLEPYQTKGLTWVDSKSRVGLVQLDAFDFNGEDYGPVPARLKYKRVRKKTAFRNGQPVLTYRVNAYLLLDDKHVIDARPGNSRDVRQALTLAFRSKIAAEISESVKASRQLNVDFLQLKTQFHRYKSGGLKDFEQSDENDFLRDLTVEYEITCRVK